MRQDKREHVRDCEAAIFVTRAKICGPISAGHIFACQNLDQILWEAFLTGRSYFAGCGQHFCGPISAGQYLRAKICGPHFVGQFLRAKICGPKFACQNLRANICRPIFAGQNLRAKICGPIFAGQNLRANICGSISAGYILFLLCFMPHGSVILVTWSLCDQVNLVHVVQYSLLVDFVSTLHVYDFVHSGFYLEINLSCEIY